jgi:hypothetical protein
MSTSDDGTDAPRPWDPAGTQPRHDPDSLLPERAEPLLPPDAEIVESDAVDEDGGDMLPERHSPGGAPAPVAAAAGHSSYSSRFHFLTGALLAVGVAAIVGIAILIIGPSTTHPGPPWSAWKPTTGGVDGARQIADHVATEYRQNGEQLVNVETNGLSFRGIPLTVALRQDAAQGGNIQVHDDSGLLYQMCGLGPNCSIERGKPSRERMLLLRREGLELALYSFRYLGVQQVVVLVPPRAGRAQTIALYFRQPDLRSELERPLAASLVAHAPSVKTVSRSPDTSLVSHVTAPYVFTLMGSSFNDRGFLVLDPYTPAKDNEVQRQLRQGAAAAAAGAAAAGATGG